MKEFPKLYPSTSPLYPKGVHVSFSFDCDDGWFQLIYDLSKEILRVMDNTPDDSFENFIVLQVKEKFGGLRYYVGAANTQIFDIIHKAEEKSMRTCERCGKRGTLSIRGGWFKTLCAKCREKDGFEKVKP